MPQSKGCVLSISFVLSVLNVNMQNLTLQRNVGRLKKDPVVVIINV